MDYLEYKDFLAHGKIYVSYDGGKTQTEIKKKPSSNSLGARIKRRLSGKKPIGGQTTTGSVGGKSGRKWKSHKYIAIINGRYIYPAKKALKQTFTKEGRQAKRLALARSEGTARERAAVSKKQYYKELNNETEAQRQKINVGQRKNKQSRDYGAAVQRETEARARREAHAKTYNQNSEIADKHSAKLKRMDMTENTINRLRGVLGKGQNASSKFTASVKKVNSKKTQKELNQQAINAANGSSDEKRKKAKPHEAGHGRKRTEPTASGPVNKRKVKNKNGLTSSLKEIADYAGKKIKNGEVTFGPDPEAIKNAVREQKKKKKR